jgi:cyanophycin synthetase
MAEQQAAAPARALADATLDRLRDRVGSAPEDGEARLALARGLIAAGDAAAALPHLDRLVAGQPPHLTHWIPLAQALIMTGDLARADACLRTMRRSGVRGQAIDELDRRLRTLIRERCGVRIQGKPVATLGLPADRAQPAVVLRVVVTCPPLLDLGALEREMAEGFDLALPPPTAEPPDPAWAVADLLGRLAVALQLAASLPIFDRVRILDPDGGPGLRMLVPAADDGAALVAVDGAAAVLSSFLAHTDWTGLRGRLREGAGQFLERLRRAAPPTGNGIHFVRAAHRLGVPWLRYGAHAYQVGHGVHARWLDSSLTDRTPSIGVALAQNKMVTSAILRRAGLPAPPHGRAATAEVARSIAAQLGYPVVVKPMSRDGGVGVAAGLEDAAALDAAFAATREVGDDVLVEKHVDGDDYRLFVMDGRVTWAIERVPGGVSGDGVQSLARLLEALNADPRRGAGKQASLQRVEWDAEAEHLARRQGLGPESVPAAGRFVRLRRITNVARGGMPVPFPLERIHPANLRLAERAAAALRLDLAGIDFITPDIGRPWHEVGGAINEVNARPSLGFITAGHLFPEIVRWLLAGGDGRIPIVAILGDEEGEDGTGLAAPLARAVHAMLCGRGLRAGLATADGAWIGTEQVAWDDRAGERGGALLLTDRGVEAAVVTMPLDGLDRTGAPFDRCCVVVRLGGGAAAPDPFEAGFVGRAMRALVAPAAAMARLEGCGPAARIPVPEIAGEGPGLRVERYAAAIAAGLELPVVEAGP